MTKLADQLFANKYTPKLQHLYEVSFPDALGLSPLYIVKFARPSVSFGTVEMGYLNQRRSIAAPVERREDIQMTLEDPIENSTSNVVEAWRSLIMNQSTGRGGYPSIYMQTVIVKVKDYQNEVVEQWTFEDAFLTNINFGDLGVEGNTDGTQKVQIQCTLKYNRYHKDF